MSIKTVPMGEVPRRTQNTGPEPWLPPVDAIACRRHDPELWFPHDTEDYSFAASVCGGCVLRAACNERGRETKSSGVWGGELLQMGRPLGGYRAPGRPRKVA